MGQLIQRDRFNCADVYQSFISVFKKKNDNLFKHSIILKLVIGSCFKFLMLLKFLLNLKVINISELTNLDFLSILKRLLFIWSLVYLQENLS